MFIINLVVVGANRGVTKKWKSVHDNKNINTWSNYIDLDFDEILDG